MTCSDFFVLHHSQNLLENTTNINVQYVDATAAQAVAIARVFETTAISCHGRSELFVYHSWKEKQKDIKAHAEFSPFPFHAFVSPVFGLICVSFIFHIVNSTCFNINEQHFLNKHIYSRLQFALSFYSISSTFNVYIYNIQLNRIHKNK